MKTKLTAVGTALLAAITLTTLLAWPAQAQTGPGTALSLDGTSQYVSATIPPLASNYTISAWVFLRAGTNIGVLTGTDCGNSTELLIQPPWPLTNSNVYLELGRCNSFGGNTGSQPMPTNQWVHVAVTVSSSQQVSYFINGAATGGWDASSYDLTLGPDIHLADNSYRHFDGLLDEMQIWSVARTQADIQAAMNRPLTGNEAGLLAYWRFDEGSGTTATDASGHGYTGTLVASPPYVLSSVPFAPGVITAAATSLGLTNATLNGSVNPGNLASSAWFEWGTTTNYGNTTVLTSLPATNASLALSATLANLAPGQTYHFHLVADNSAGTTPGADQTFTIPTPAPPTVTTAPATFISSTAVMLTGTVNPNNQTTTAWFEWGATTNYGNTTAVAGLSATNASLSVSATLTNLAPGQTYHFHLVANNSVGTTPDADQTFQMPAFVTVNSGLPPATQGYWGDYDNDGWLDVLLWMPAPDSHYRLYHNNGDGTFTWNTNAGLPAVPVSSGFAFPMSSAAWGDYDNDGRLDLLITSPALGSGSSPCLYHNNGDGTFTGNTNAGLPAVNYGCVAWGNFDNDGRLDLLIAGQTLSGEIVTQIYHNNGDGTFTDINAGLLGVFGGSVALGDFDNDGRLDILIAGVAISNSVFDVVTRLYRNNGDGTFTWSTNAVLPQVAVGSVAWGDYDNDGKLDILIAGLTLTNGVTDVVTRVYRNNGDSTFTWNTNAVLPQVAYGSVAWGDYDNDGKLDVLIAGIPLTNGVPILPVTRVYRNNGDGTFTDLNLGLPGVGSGAWGDYDNDGRLDFLLAGSTADPGITNACFSGLYRNLSPAANTPPTAPAGLVADASSGGLTLTWAAASDAQTPSAGLTYNLRMGTTPGGSDIVSPQSNPTSGFRLLPGMGNAQNRINAFLAGLPGGTTYYWSVQAVDSAMAGSAFAAEDSFFMPGRPAVITLPATGITPGQATLQGSVNPGDRPTIAWFEWGTNTDYGNFTPMTNLGNGFQALPVSNPLTGLAALTTYHYQVVAFNNLGVAVGADQSFTTPDFSRAITRAGFTASGQFQFQFTGAAASSYTVLSTTNVALPMSAWSNLGPALETPPGAGHYQFTDTATSNRTKCFYRLRWP